MIFMMGAAVPAMAVAEATLGGDDGAAPSSIHALLSGLSAKSAARRLQVTQDRPACAADLNADGVVATDDLLYLLASYGRRSADCVPPTYLDLNGASRIAHLHLLHLLLALDGSPDLLGNCSLGRSRRRVLYTYAADRGQRRPSTSRPRSPLSRCVETRSWTTKRPSASRRWQSTPRARPLSL